MTPRGGSSSNKGAYKNIKPTDAAIIGLYPRYSDQVTETVKMVQQALA